MKRRFVRATPGSALAEKCKMEFRRLGLKIKVVERTGKSVKSCLVKSNPFRKVRCDKENCIVCNLDGNVDCRARSVHYRISCEGVNKEGEHCSGIQYEGETSRSTGERFPEHLNLIRNKKEQLRQKSVFYDHAWEAHGGAVPPLKFEVLGRFPDDPAMRQATEAVSIRRNKPVLNSKQEWTNEPKVRRVQDV